jgi:predicted 3-demethylubiquinone-9 3-methyltransferase (glyoxalase superfamily)
MKRITPCLWFNGNAEEAVNYYLSVFKNAKINNVTHYGDAGPMSKGTVLTIEFELDGHGFLALNGESDYKFSPATSFMVNCDTQEEVDYYWEKLTAGGKEVQCGWLEDKFGMSWQIVPSMMIEVLSGPDKAKADRVMKAMMEMIKLDIPTLKAAAKQS